MPQPNAELVRRAYEAFNNADVEALRRLFADTTIFHEPGHSPISGDYHGLDQVLRSHHYEQHEFDEFWT